MRVAILSDIHGNLAAFEAVLAHLTAQGGYDEIWCLGDVVGYGPQPNECVERLRRERHLAVIGNHDWAAIGRMDVTEFNPVAAAAAHWTAAQLSAETRRYLEDLPELLVRGDFTIAHGSPRDPVWEYILSAGQASENFACFATRYCLVGHSHVPIIFRLFEATGWVQVERWPRGLPLELGSQRLILNPGGVGQPRDGDPRAAYALLDLDARTIHHFRVAYDVAATQRRIRQADLPAFLADRLAVGR